MPNLPDWIRRHYRPGGLLAGFDPETNEKLAARILAQPKVKKKRKWERKTKEQSAAYNRQRAQRSRLARVCIACGKPAILREASPPAEPLLLGRPARGDQEEVEAGEQAEGAPLL